MITCGLIPYHIFAATQKFYTGSVTNILGTQLEFSTTSGAYYTAQTQNVTLIKRYGAPMLIGEIIKGDKIQVTGTARQDNSIAASLVRDMSLYSHNGTFTGKITSFSPLSNYIIIDSRQWGTQTIRTNAYTVFKKNGAASTISDLAAGMTVIVKGAWERSVKDVDASSVQTIIRLVAIDITGNLVLRGGGMALTVIANNTIYGIDAANAQILNKKNQPINVMQLGDIVRVWGKHISGSTEIVASKIKDN